MGSCKECYHYEVCRMHYQQKCELTYETEKEVRRAMLEAEKGNPICDHFKDRSRFVDIAEVKRKIIRPLCNRCAALTDCQTCPACALEIREHCEHYKEAEQALKLKERENNA